MRNYSARSVRDFDLLKADRALNYSFQIDFQANKSGAFQLRFVLCISAEHRADVVGIARCDSVRI